MARLGLEPIRVRPVLSSLHHVPGLIFGVALLLKLRLVGMRRQVHLVLDEFRRRLIRLRVLRGRGPVRLSDSLNLD